MIKESMTIKDAIISGIIAINDTLMPFVACEPCDDDSNDNSATPNLKNP